MRGGADSADASRCGPRRGVRGRRGRGWRGWLGCRGRGSKRMPPSSSVAGSGPWRTAQRTIRNNPTIGIFKITISQMKVQAFTPHPIVLPIPTRRRLCTPIRRAADPDPWAAMYSYSPSGRSRPVGGYVLLFAERQIPTRGRLCTPIRRAADPDPWAAMYSYSPSGRSRPVGGYVLLFAERQIPTRGRLCTPIRRAADPDPWAAWTPTRRAARARRRTA